ncbi:MAG: hypothetical protein DRP87_19250 [Spirochaetes bacterium]|nr:MAG: hypothetical protein DRP87_19250 [Spirochaetota bacterium]
MKQTPLIRYISNIWLLHVKQANPIPIDLPIFFYHGKRKWKRVHLSHYSSGYIRLFSRFIP